MNCYIDKLTERAEKKARRYLFGNDSDNKAILFLLNKSQENYHNEVEQFKKLFNSNDKLLQMAAWNGLYIDSVYKLSKEDFTEEELRFIKDHIRCSDNCLDSYSIKNGKIIYPVNKNSRFFSSRLMLKPAEMLEDLELYKKHLKNDGDFWLYTAKKLTKENIELFVQALKQPYNFFVYEKGNNNLVGMVGFYDYDDGLRKAKAQWYIFKPYRNKGYAKEAVTALAERAFSGKLFELRGTGWEYKYRKHYAKIDLIEADIREKNVASQKTAESCGFKYLYTANRYFLVDGGEPENGKHYELTPKTLKKPDC